jgi:hypothetical protein
LNLFSYNVAIVNIVAQGGRVYWDFGATFFFARERMGMTTGETQASTIPGMLCSDTPSQMM